MTCSERPRLILGWEVQCNHSWRLGQDDDHAGGVTRGLPPGPVGWHVLAFDLDRMPSGEARDVTGEDGFLLGGDQEAGWTRLW